MLLLIIYLSASETLISHREMSLIGSTSFGFAQNTIHDYQNTVVCHKNHLDYVKGYAAVTRILAQTNGFCGICRRQSHNDNEFKMVLKKTCSLILVYVCPKK